VTVRWWALLPVGLVLAVVATRANGAVAGVLGVAGLGGLVTFTARNLHLAGMGILTAGLGLNLLAIVVNAGMPVRPGALVTAGVVDTGEAGTVELAGYRYLERPEDPLPIIGDVIPLPLGRSVVSVGDLVIAVGVADVVAHLTRRRRRVDRFQDLRMWLPPEEVAVATEGGPDLGVEPVWRDDIELLDADIDLGDRPRDPTDPDITIPIRQLDRHHPAARRTPARR
jgi:hypothetical protein